MQTLGLLCAKLKFSEYASHIIHPLAKLIDREGSAAVQLRKEAMDTLCALIPQLQSDFAVFIPMVRLRPYRLTSVFKECRRQHSDNLTPLFT
jgi:FKBP12-rapamycin complex-associated protein